MFKNLSITLLLTAISAQEEKSVGASTVSGSCCPSACPTFQSQLCCQACPKLCLTPPDQSAPIEIIQLDDECKKTQLTWSGASSCAPLRKTELQCLGGDGEWYTMPEVAEKSTALTVNNELFAQPPFNLAGGSDLYCQLRSSSKWGWGVWSPSNDRFQLPDCSPPVIEEEPEEEEELELPCACNNSCKSFGCGGCCGSQGAQLQDGKSFWGKVAQKGSCAMGGRCGKPQEVPAYSEQAKRHEHKYCHVDKSPQFVKKTKWVTKTIKGKRTFLEPRMKKVIDTIMVKRVQHVPDVVYQPQEVISKQKVMKKVVNKVPRAVQKERTVQKANTTYVLEAYTEEVTKMKNETKSVKKVRFIPQVVDVQELRFDQQTRIDKKSKWVSEKVLSNRLVQAANSCGCFKQQCGCQGQAGCDCCFPKCGCAPQNNGYQTVQVLTEQQVERPYEIETVTNQPKVVSVQRTIQQPEVYFEDVTVQVPYVETVTKSRRVPQVTYTSHQEKYTDYEFDDVPGEQEFEEDVRQIVTVPKSILTAVEVEEPQEVQKEIIEQIAVVRPVDLQIKVPITIVERLPEPPCHWHTLVHSHEVVQGQTHTHTEDHDHN